MFFHRREDNWVAEEHRSPVLSVFLFGGMSGLIITAHYITVTDMLYDAVQLCEAFVSGLCFAGVMSVGLFRAVENIYEQQAAVDTVTKRIKFFFSGLFIFVGVSGVSAVIGAIPLAFIDFVGGRLVHTPFNLDEFYILLRQALWLGVYLGSGIGTLMMLGLMLRLLTIRLTLLSFIVCGATCGAALGLLIGQFHIQFLPLYGTIFGIFFGIALVLQSRKLHKKEEKTD